jgi:hypothetical protein
MLHKTHLAHCLVWLILTLRLIIFKRLKTASKHIDHDYNTDTLIGIVIALEACSELGDLEMA